MKLPIDPSDRAIIDYLRRHEQASICDLVELLEITATAVRQRLARLMKQGLVLRESESAGRGRPTHRYFLSRAGIRSAGDNYEDLVGVLWSELRAVKNPEVRRGLLQRVVARMGELYREKLHGSDLRERMTELAQLMGECDVPFEVVESEDADQLPVLTAFACPYPDLAEQDRTICSMEKMLFSELLGESVRLSACRLDGDSCCTFEASATAGST